MGFIEDIKKEAVGARTKIQTTEERDMETKLNNLFYLDKNIEEETRLVKSIMTRGTESTERKGLHASAIIVSDEKFCYRQQVLSLFYKQRQGEQHSPATRRIFTEGDSVHEKWQRLFIRGGYTETRKCDKTRFCKEYDLQYTPDIICNIDGVKMIVEIKSVNTIQYKKMEKENKPHLSGKKQLFFYMFLTGIKKGFTLCEDKNTQEFRVNIYEYDDNETKKYIERLEKIQMYKKHFLEGNRIVRRHEKCTDYGCKMAAACPMADVCYARSIEKL